MASIDERVVVMSFENAKFEAGVAVTQATLAKLNASLANIGKVTGLENIEKAAQKVTLEAPMSALDKLRARLGQAGQGAAEGFGSIESAASKVNLLNPLDAIDKLRLRLGSVGAGAADGFNEIEKASNRVSFRGLSSALDSVSVKFSAVTAAFTAAIGSLSVAATQEAQSLVKKVSVGPLIDGFKEYTTNLQSIQTILSNTKASGADLDDVNDALNQLNKYSDQTIYNFGQMAHSIGLFTAAGVDLDTSVASIKGIANLAALSGSSSDQATHSMQQLSQAISSGRVGMQDWNSVVNAGMGGATFQRALATTAENMGTLSDGAVKLKGKMKNVTIEGQSFRESIMAAPGKESWLTSKVLTNTLQQFTGDLSDAELAAQGFTDSQIKAIQETAKTAKDAATQVKDLKQLFGVAAEAMGTGWSDSFALIFGNFQEAKKTFTNFSQQLNGLIGDTANARNKILGDWKELGGRTELIKGIKAAFVALGSVLKPIHDAFREIFPRKTGQDLFELTVRFREFMENLKIGPETAANLKRSFAGLFALLHIGKTIIGGILGVIADLLGVVGEGSGGFLAFTGSIGDFLVAIDFAISKGHGLEGVFHGLENALRAPLELIKAVASAISDLFSPQTLQDKHNALESGTTALDRLAKTLGPLGDALRAVVKIWEKFFQVTSDIAQFLQPILADIADIFSHIGDAIMDGLNQVSYNDIMTFIQTTFLGGLAFGIKKLLKGVGLDLTGGTLKGFKDVLSTLSGTLTAIQRNVNARTMLLIAAAVLALAGAAVIFAQIDAKKLAQAMTAITIGIAQLSGAMFALTKVAKGGVFLTLPFIAAAMLILAAAMIVLAGAVKIFSTMSWEDLTKGLAGVAGGLIAIGAATKLMGPSLILVGPGLVAVAIAMNLLAVAMKIFGEMKWEQIGKGLVAIGGSLLIIGAAVKGIGPGILIAGPGLILASIGLILLSGAVSSFGNMDLQTLGKGLLGIAASLVVLGIAISAVPPTVALQAAGLVILGIALTSIAAAVGAMGSLGIATIAKGLIAIAAALVIFAVGLTAMAGTIPGSLALLAAATAFAILTPALIVLGSLKWSTIIKGLGAIALTLGVLAVVGALAAGPLTSLGVAFLVIAGSVLLASAGIYLMAKGFSLLGDEGSKGVSVMIAAVTAFIALIPKMVIDFLKGLVDILTGLAKLAPQIAESLVKILGVWLGALQELLPKVAVLVGSLVLLIIQILDENGPPLIDAGIRFLRHFLEGLASNVGAVTAQVVLIVARFLAALAANAPKLAESGAKALVAWLKGISAHIDKVVTQAANLIVHFLEGIAKNLPKVYAAGIKVITAWLNSIATAIPKIIRSGVNMILGVIQGITEALPRLVKAAVTMIVKFIRAIGAEAPRIADAGAKAAIDFLNGLATAIRDNDDKLFKAMRNVGDAIIDGLIEGLEQGADAVKDKLLDIAKGGVNKVLNFFGIHSPSTLFQEIGRFTMLGLAKGIGDTAKPVNESSVGVGQGVIDTFKKTFGIHSPSEVMRELGQFVGEGFAQGLHGSRDDITAAFKDLNARLQEQMRSSRQIIAEEQAKINDELKQKKPDLTAIKESQKVIAQNELILKKSRQAHSALIEALSFEKNALLGMTREYEHVSKKLEAARAALDEAKSARDSAKSSLIDKFDTTPTIDKESPTAVADYAKALREQVAATKSYSETLAKLRAIGLDDKTYQKLLDEGLAGKDFAESLLAGGKTAVDGINSLDTELLAASTTLATNAATALYQAGVDAAQGLVNGLKSKKHELAASMDFIADELVRAIRRKLKIKSPSQIFEGIGKLTVEGMVLGLKNSANKVTSAASQLGADAVTAMQSSIAGISAAIADNIDTDPVITPILDLTNIERDAQKLDSLSNVTPITAAPSFQQAAAISQEQQVAQAEAAAATEVKQFNFEQNNYSPEKLSEIEIYRQTTNQLAQAKSALGLAP